MTFAPNFMTMIDLHIHLSCLIRSVSLTLLMHIILCCGCTTRTLSMHGCRAHSHCHTLVR